MNKNYTTVEKKTFYQKHMLPDINFLLTDNCNLNCASCTSYSPLAKEHFTSSSAIEQDAKQLAQITENSMYKVARIDLMGGEPLLHPEITEIMKSVRKYFPKTNIAIETNGILLKAMQKKFWETAKETAITVRISLYEGINSVEGIQEFAKEKGAIFRENYNTEDWIIENDGKFYIETNGGSYTWKSYPLDITGKQNIIYNHEYCELHCCCCLHEGKFYPCTRIPTIKHFNKYFSTNIDVSQNDSIDIYENCTTEKLVNFLSNPTPFCKYCKVKEEREIKWKKSKNEIKEWI